MREKLFNRISLTALTIIAIVTGILASLINDVIASAILQMLKLNIKDYILESQLLLSPILYLLLRRYLPKKIMSFPARHTFFGAQYAFLLTLLTALIFYLNGGIGKGIVSFRMLLTIAGVFSISFAEEIIFRGVILEKFREREKRMTGLLITSMLWSMAHLFNANFNPFSYINTFMFGIIIGGLFLKDKNLSGATAFHFVWNLMLFNVFGFTLSGIGAGFSIFRPNLSEIQGLLWGGGYGPEGSIIVTMLLLLPAIRVIKRELKQSTSDKSTSDKWGNEG